MFGIKIIKNNIEVGYISKCNLGLTTNRGEMLLFNKGEKEKALYIAEMYEDIYGDAEEYTYCVVVNVE